MVDPLDAGTYRCQLDTVQSSPATVIRFHVTGQRWGVERNMGFRVLELGVTCFRGVAYGGITSCRVFRLPDLGVASGHSCRVPLWVCSPLHTIGGWRRVIISFRAWGKLVRGGFALGTFMRSQDCSSLLLYQCCQKESRRRYRHQTSQARMRWPRVRGLGVAPSRLQPSSLRHHSLQRQRIY